MNWWQKLGCFLIGWNPKILMNCTEASHKALKKYTASILILVFIWGATGYCFAERYLSVTSWWGCALTALSFIVIVIQIERQVILTVGKNRLLTIFRVILAVFMALIGSAILDQIIFKNDVAKVLRASNRSGKDYCRQATTHHTGRDKQTHGNHGFA